MIELDIFEASTKLLGVLGGMLAIYKAVKKYSAYRLSKLRDDYKFLERFIELVERRPLAHNILVEQGYRAFSGYDLSAYEIRALLKLKCPSRALKIYARARRFLTVDESRVSQVCFSEKFRNAKVRSLFKFLQIGGYVLFAPLAVSPVLFVGNLVDVFGMFEAIVISFVFFISFGFMAIIFPLEHGRITAAESLVNGKYC